MSMKLEVGDVLPPLKHTATALQLFRYSAVTWNPHRIHFDESYAHQEGHAGVAVHSHLRAALALRCVSEGLGPDWQVTKLAYRLRKPVYALIAGREAKEGVSMGHAGALVLGDAGTLASKTQRLTQAGARVFGSIEAIVEACTADFAAIRA